VVAPGNGALGEGAGIIEGPEVVENVGAVHGSVPAQLHWRIGTDDAWQGAARAYRIHRPTPRLAAGS
jgi:hypothetical protein